MENRNCNWQKVLSVTDLNKRLGDFSLENIRLSLPAGCVMGLVGENGAGKSTLIKTVLGIWRADSGVTELFGKTFDGSERAVLERVGVVMDEEQFPETMTASQIGSTLGGIYKQWDNGAYESYLRRFSLPRTKPLRQLSKGMKMKLSIAAALSHRAELLILDEPTSGLDPVMRDEVCELLADFVSQGSNAVLFSSHIVSDLEKTCDYITFLHKGRVLLCEEKDRLKEEYGILRCPAEKAQAFPAAARRVTPYGAELLLRRADVPGKELGQATIEDIFLFFSRGSQPGEASDTTVSDCAEKGA